MIIALANDDGSLFLFASHSEAEREFEAIDVQNGEYEFLDQFGRRLLPELASPIKAFDPGSYRLVKCGSADREELSRMLSRAKSLARFTEEIPTIDDLRRALFAEQGTPVNWPGRPRFDTRLDSGPSDYSRPVTQLGR